MRLYIIRHGETSWNREGRLQGQTDIPLCEDGIVMTRSCAEGMKDIPIDFCFSSSLTRAKETAEILVGKNRGYRERAEELLPEVLSEGIFSDKVTKTVNYEGGPVMTDSRIIEAGFGPWEGLICKKDGYNVPLKDFGTYWREPDSPELAEGVEHITWVAKRVISFFTDLTRVEALSDKNVLVVVHGCVMRVVMYLTNKENCFTGKVPYNCEVMICEPDGEGGLKEIGREIYYDKSMVHDNYAGMKQE